MVVLKTSREIALIKEACEISAGALKLVCDAVEPGVSTKTLDSMAESYIRSNGATPSFLGYGGFPASTCISINNEVIHGIPRHDRVIMEGDIVSIDLGAFKNGYHGDNAATVPAGKVSTEAQRLIDVTRESLYAGIKAIGANMRLGDIGSAVQKYAEARGYSVVRKFVGHGVGAALHEEPSVPNYGTPGRGMRLVPGMTLAIEPMVNQGGYEVKVMPDRWTVVTADGKLSAHFEHTVAVTSDGAEILTKVR